MVGFCLLARYDASAVSASAMNGYAVVYRYPRCWLFDYRRRGTLR